MTPGVFHIRAANRYVIVTSTVILWKPSVDSTSQLMIRMRRLATKTTNKSQSLAVSSGRNYLLIRRFISIIFVHNIYVLPVSRHSVHLQSL